MIKLFHSTTLLGAALLLAACGGDAGVSDPETREVAPEARAEADAPAALSFADTIADPRRADDAARDRFRNPAPTLDFFQVGPGQRVAEIWPGWYTPVIAPYMATHDGTYVAVLYPEGISERLDERIQGYKDRYADDYYGDIEYASFWNFKDTGEGTREEAGPKLSLADDSVDRILTFRNVHNWMGGDYADGAFAEFYRALKPGGLLGVVEHRLPETRTQDPKGASGYVQESYMKDMAARAGFEFAGASEVNANPLDTADHPMGVWTLPPRSRLPEPGSEAAKDFDAALYKNIGESDRATLLFRKPG